jgi:hypothetical protein
VLVILGVTAGIVVSALPSTTSVTLPTEKATSTTTKTSGPTTTTTTRTIISAAAVAECTADVKTIQLAEQAYAAEHGAPPPAGSAWATASAGGGPFLHSWPSAPGQFTVRWTGAALVVTPVHGRAATGTGTAAPPTGCYAA